MKDHSHAIAYNNLASLYMTSGMYEKAIRFATKALQIIEVEVKSVFPVKETQITPYFIITGI